MPASLWPGTTDSALSNVDPASAIAAGLVVRPLDESIDDVLEWWGAREWPRHWLDADDEARLLGDGSADRD